VSASTEPTRREALAIEFVEMAADALGCEGAAYEAFKRKYKDDPVAFAQDCVEWPDGEGLTAYQAEIIAAVPAHGRVAVRGPHGLGKTALAALLVLWFALTRDGEDWKILTTASAWRQLSKYLWPEIEKWSARVRWDVIGRRAFSKRHELQTLALKLKTGEAFAVASDDPGLVEGAHGDSALLIIDEGKSVPATMWDALEGLLAGDGEVMALAISTPGEPSGRFYEIHRRAPGLEDWRPIHVTLEQCIAAGRVSRDWAEQRAKQWGADSAVYLNRVKGEFCTDDEAGVIPLQWIELAIERHHEWVEAGRPGEFVSVGVDVARSGRDKTTLALRFGLMIGELRRYSKQCTMTTTGHVVKVLDAFGGLAVVDVIGVGAGVVDRLRELQHRTIAFNASERTDDRDRSGELSFLNKRAAAWWHMRELLDPAYGAEVGLPDDAGLIGDLCAPRWWINSSGKVQIESKDDIRKRLGRSTDAADAVIQAFSGAATPAVLEYHSVVKRRHTFGRRRSLGRQPRGWA